MGGEKFVQHSGSILCFSKYAKLFSVKQMHSAVGANLILRYMWI